MSGATSGKDRLRSALVLVALLGLAAVTVGVVVHVGAGVVVGLIVLVSVALYVVYARRRDRI